jgi:prepilin-type processing-associated H-X9-DG protein
MMPALGRAKKLAQNVVDKMNMRSWGLIWYIFTEDNDGKFTKGNSLAGGQENWYNKASYYEGEADIRFCPTTKKNDGTFPFSSWDRTGGVSNNYDETDAHSSYATGSYGINDYIHQPKDPDSKVYWGNTDSPYSSKIPVIGDAVYWKVKQPNAAQPIPIAEDDPGIGTYGLTKACLNRHGGYTNWLFLDWSVKSVGLKAIWSRDVMWRRDWRDNLQTSGVPNFAGTWMENMPDKIK